MSSEVSGHPTPTRCPTWVCPGGAGKQGNEVKTAPTGAMAATVMSASRSCHTRPMKAATAMVE